ncbi:hypothetical protein [Streptomyces sp. PanSC19]|nr:hypothetical protein [Streptomyces sp. PanSC19]
MRTEAFEAMATGRWKLAAGVRAICQLVRGAVRRWARITAA